MRIVVTKSMLDRVMELVAGAQDAGKVVERVVLTPSEMEALLNCPIGPNKDDPLGQRSCFKDNEIYVLGVRVVSEAPRVPALERSATERTSP